MRKPLWMLNNENKYSTIPPAFTGNFYVKIDFPNVIGNQNDIGFLASRVTLPNISLSTITTGKTFGLKDTFPSSIDLGGQTTTITFFETNTYKVSRTLSFWLECLSNTQTGMPIYPFRELKGTIHIVVCNSLQTLRYLYDSGKMMSIISDLQDDNSDTANEAIDTIPSEVKTNTWTNSILYIKLERAFPTSINLDEFAPDVTTTNIQMITSVFSFARLRIRFKILKQE